MAVLRKYLWYISVSVAEKSAGSMMLIGMKYTLDIYIK